MKEYQRHIPKGWRQLRLGEIVPDDLMVNEFSNLNTNSFRKCFGWKGARLPTSYYGTYLFIIPKIK